MKQITNLWDDVENQEIVSVFQHVDVYDETA